MLQSKAAMYGVLAVVEVARRQAEGAAGVQAHEVAKTFTLPIAYCAKIMSLLARAGILRSGRGPRGGFKMAKRPEQVTLLDIFRAVRGPLPTHNPIRRLRASPNIARAINLAMDRAFQSLCRELQGVSVADILKP